MIEGGYSHNALKGASSLDPTDHAEVALFLNSDMARMITGVALPCDAGHLALVGNNPTPVKG